jgi:monofunctional biosynthetic peptidoglycan transglycosylase
VKDGGQVNHGAQAGQSPNAGRIRQGWVALTGRVRAAVAARPIKNALARLTPALPARLRHLPLPSGVRRSLDLVMPHVRLAVRTAALALAASVVIVLGLVVAYRWINPPISTLMLGQSIAGTAIERTWVPIERISPYLIRAVVVSEDGRFCAHSGVDLPALHDAITHDRGGSTITMQVVKNLFLWPSRSYVRKVIEIGLAYLVDAFWPKRRILEIYLNIAEWGEGVFGAEAAAATHFAKTAARLTAEEAALLAVALPNPLERAPGLPSAGTNRLAARLLLRMATSRVNLACVRSGGGLQTRPVPKPTPKPVKPDPKGNWEYLFPSTD